MPRPPRVPLLGAAFLISGASALVYQVAWQRILALQTGVGPLSIAVIVGAFMTGLGIGSHLGGKLSLRLGGPTALRAFALIELGIAAWGVASAWLYYDVLYVRFGGLYQKPAQGALLHMASLLLPTLLMGMSLPLLVRGCVRQAGTAGRTIGILYGLNVLGASLGALVTPWVLIRFFGVRGALVCAALGNVIAFLCALLIAGRGEEPLAAPAEELLPRDARETSPTRPATETPLAFWAALYGLSGFCALSLELIWFRLVDVAVKSTAFTFGTILSLYLLGAGMGSVLAASRVSRLQHPLRAFLACQCALLAYAGTAVLLLVYLPPETAGLSTLVAFWREPSSGLVLPATLDLPLLGMLYGVLPVVLFGPSTLLMGASFPILHRAVQDDPRTSGHKTGQLQAANIAGSALGSLGVGLFGFDLLGTAGLLRLLMLLGLAFALLGLRVRPALFASLAASLALLAVFMPAREPLWRRLHGAIGPASLGDEDSTGVAAIIPSGGHKWNVLLGGKRLSWLPFGRLHSHLGALPAVIHPAPLDVAIVGLGSGDSAWAAGCRTETRSVNVFELSARQMDLLRALAASEPAPQLSRLRRFLEDPRVRLEVRDGRNALFTDDRLYDIIEADALLPTAAYSGNLYSEEFFSICARKLKPGGIVCTWAPTARVAAGFTRVFPHVLAVEEGRVLFGAKERIPMPREAWRQRLTQGPIVDYLGGKLAIDVLEQLRRARRFEPVPGEANLDLFPRDEFATPGPPGPATAGSPAP